MEFLAAAQRAAREVDLLVEVGPGTLMADLVGRFVDTPAIALDVGGESLAPLLRAAGAGYVLGRAPEIAALFEGRFARRFDWDWKPKFFQNPCETFPAEPLSAADLEPEPAGAAALEEPTRDPAASAADELRRIIAEHTGLPAWSFEDSTRLSSELHLNSITASDIVIRLAVARGLQTPVDPTEYADASIGEIAAAMERLAEAGAVAGGDGGTSARGVGSWVRHFEVVSVPAVSPSVASGLEPGEWDVLGARSPWVDALAHRLNTEPFGSGVLFCLDADPGVEDRAALLSAAQRCADGRFVVVQRGWGAGGFVRSFFLERRSLDVLLVNLPPGEHPEAVEWVVSEIGVAGFREVSFDASGARHEPRLRLLDGASTATTPVLGAGDVVLVTGGGKGISAECGFQLARRAGCALLVLGRSSPDDEELAANLERLRGGGIRVTYQVADVTDRDAVAEAVEAGIDVLGAPVTGIVHGAGINHPQTVATMTIDDLESILAPKLDGLRNVLAAVVPDRLKLLATFSSIIARAGLRGEADYALGNEWLSHETERFQRQHPSCRCRAIEWSVWSGTGMGQRLGRLDALERQGISAISIDDGVREFLQLIETPDLPTRVVVSGRFGDSQTLVPERQPSRDRFRFVDSVLVDYPGVELVTECELSPGADLYLDDHVLAGERLFPAVMALEAMTEVASALLGHDAPLRFRDVAFRAPIVVPAGVAGTLRVRVVALAERDGEISLAIRCSSTEFQVNHVEARCSLRSDPVGATVPPLPADDIPAFDPNESMYDNVLFQSGRFRRIASYQLIEARRCSGRLSTDGTTEWFARHLPQGCALGDAGARDAALHAIQACIPHKVVVPLSVGQIDIATLDPSSAHRMFATEIADHGDELIYDLTIFDADGHPVERWQRIVLRVVAPVAGLRVDAPALMAPILERRVAASLPQAGMTVSIAEGQRQRDGGRGSDHRPDGKPSNGSRFRSAAYTGPWRLAVDAGVPVGCDLERVGHRDDWAPLLGEEDVRLARIVGGLVTEDLDVSATRVWTAREAMKKAGLPASAPLVTDADSTPDWVVFRSGDATVFSSVIAGPPAAMCVAAALVTARRADRAVPVKATASRRPSAGPDGLAVDRPGPVR